MEVHYNLEAALIANLSGTLILVSILISSNILHERKNSKYNRWMTYMIIVCLLGCIAEIVFEVVNGKMFPFAIAINMIAKTANHVESIFAGFLFIGAMRSIMYEDEEHWPKPVRYITALVCTFGAILYIVNPFTGWAFIISNENLYSRGPLGQLGLLISMSTLVYSAIILTIENKKTKTYLHFPVMMYALPFIVGGGLQMFYSSLRLSNVAFALGIATTHLSVQRTFLYTDHMTGVFNRAFFDYFFRKSLKNNKGKAYGGMLLDINSFKQINDNFGHSAGDEAIKNAADIIKKAVDRDFIIMRYGGDEFILVKENAGAEEIQIEKNKINEAATAFNKDANHPYELTFSTGVAQYNSDKEDFNKFLKRMDDALYLDKKEYYEKSGKERRR